MKSLEHFMALYESTSSFADASVHHPWSKVFADSSVRLKSISFSEYTYNIYYKMMMYVASSLADICRLPTDSLSLQTIGDVWLGIKLVDEIADTHLDKDHERFLMNGLSAMLGRTYSPMRDTLADEALDTLGRLSLYRDFTPFEDMLTNLFHAAILEKKSSTSREFHNASVLQGKYSGLLLLDILSKTNSVSVPENTVAVFEYYGIAGNLMDNLRDIADDEKQFGAAFSIDYKFRLAYDSATYFGKLLKTSPTPIRLINSIRVPFIFRKRLSACAKSRYAEPYSHMMPQPL